MEFATKTNFIAYDLTALGSHWNVHTAILVLIGIFI